MSPWGDEPTSGSDRRRLGDGEAGFVTNVRLLAVCGSLRSESTNAALLRAIAAAADPGTDVELFGGLGELPIFSPDREGEATPPAVEAFCASVRDADGLIVSSPEYVRAIPGGLKNAIDWLVSRDEMIDKPVALAHASHRGDDMLGSLRSVLSTVTSGFDEVRFLRLPLVGLSLEQARTHCELPENTAAIREFVQGFRDSIVESRGIADLARKNSPTQERVGEGRNE